MAQPEYVTLSSEKEIEQAQVRLTKFCDEEYSYYDGLSPFTNPDQIEPIDILATLSVNSYINNAKWIRDIHRGMVKNCSELLAEIPHNSNLLTCNPSTLEVLKELLNTAIQIPRVLIPVATKILHRKRPNLIPMLDNVVIKFYLNTSTPGNSWSHTQDKKQAARIAMTVLDYFRQHLQNLLPKIELLQTHLAQKNYILTPVRILEILVWLDQTGYYSET